MESRRRPGWLLVVLAVVPLAGCSFSVSSWSLSKSSRSSSHSADSSSSSSPAAAELAYRDDVSDYTRTWAKSRDPDLRSFQADLARLVEEHGISNWEANPVTYTAIGEGLRSAGVSNTELTTYKRGLSGGDQQKADAIQRGYDSGH